eukprot:gene1489-2870_t
MSTSKARFMPSNSKRSVSKAGSASGSKRGTVAAQSGVPGKSSSNVQVILNGKIVTPQSLLPRKGASYSQNTKKYNRRPSASGYPHEDTISELPDKSTPVGILVGKLTRKLSQSDIMAGQDRLVGRRLARNDNDKIEEKVIVMLSETATETLLCLPSLVISNETREVVAMEERNAKYELLVDSHKNSDGFSSRPTQTLNNFQKNQNEMAAPNASQDFGCQAISYDISDALARTQTVAETDTFTASATNDANDERAAGLTPHVRKFVRDTVGVAVATPGCLLNVNDLTKPPDPQEVGSRKEPGRGGGRMDSSNNTSRPQRSMAGIGGGAASRSFAVQQSDEGGGSKPSNSGIGVSAHFGGATSNFGTDDSDDPNDRKQTSEEGSGSGAPTGGGGGQPAPDGQQLLREREAAAIMESKSLLKKLQLTERTVLQNIYHRQHLDYRDLPDVKPLILTTKQCADVVDSSEQLFGSLGIGGMGMGMGSMGVGTMSGIAAATLGGKPSGSVKAKSLGATGEPMAPTDETEESAAPNPNQTSSPYSALPKLFCYRAESVVRGRPVTALAWNAANADLIAVGYGRVDFSLDGGQKPAKGMAVDEELSGGLVLFWSLRNPEHPEKVLRTAHPVTALDFSRRSPTLLALGLYNGDVDVYDVRRESDWGKAMQSSAGIEGGHTDPVWQVRWIAKGQERVETLVSISTDGRVLEWNLKKGLVVTTLMALKRGGVGEGWISRQAAGLGFDFVPGDSSTYVVGTEEGQVHRCSVSYSEQYLDTYEAHNGPVYRIRFSSRWPDVFLTSSADWTMGLYHIRSSSGRGPLLRLHCTGQDFAVTDVTWCPGNSTVLRYFFICLNTLPYSDKIFFQVFAAVTADARLQIWDLAVSAIDPVINYDTNADCDDISLSGLNDNKSNTSSGMLSKPGSPDAGTTPGLGLGATGTRRPGVTHNGSTVRRDEREDEKDKETPVARLLRSLAQAGSRRSLTCVLFGERSPIVVVGDNRGAVTIYRVTKPVLFTHDGPVQQGQKLREAVLRQSDPLEAAKLSSSNSTVSLSNATPENK